MTDKQWVDQSNEVRKRIWKRLPADIYTNNSYYLRTQLQSIAYLLIFIASYYIQHRFLLNSPQFVIQFHVQNLTFSFNLALLIPIFFGFLFAFGLCGWVMTGHDGNHLTVGPKKTAFGKVINSIANWLGYGFAIGCPDVINPLHILHHRHVNSKDDAEMVLIDYGIGELGMFLHSVWIIYRYHIRDLMFFFESVTENILRPTTLKALLKTHIIGILFVMRFFYIFGCALNFDQRNERVRDNYYVIGKIYDNGDGYCELVCCPWIAVVNFCFNANLFKYVLFGSHLSIVTKNDGRDEIDPYVHQLRNAMNIYTGNSWYDQLQQFLHCGVNAHGVHHICPFLPRSLVHIAADELRESYPEEFREINWWSDEVVAYFSKVALGFVDDMHDRK